MENNNISTKKWKDLGFKEKVSYGTALVSFMLGWLCIFVGMAIPPTGEISGSVITTFGIGLSYCGSLLGISLYVRSETSEISAKIQDKIDKYIDQKEGERNPVEDDGCEG